ncbi:HNH endonuclease signature motif containing protein [Sphingopyxis sp. YR583]|uniref:HNH endonuclease signature motif containing protein n=1 Tax=Sphingopyxis sp. YR583 TaxID=1881047 RepID=UPI001C42F8E7|nr:HNH endonuclease signature motif containing protein [Sphingopyxis sp. YR583]
MWNDDPAAVAARYGITLKQAQHLKVTAEHLVARQDGGTDTPDNIVAACTYCNDRRHRRRSPLSPEDYARKVRDRLAKGKWHRMRLT